MAGGVDVNIGADTREFASSVKSGLQTPVEDAQGALEDYTRAAQAAGDGGEASFKQQQRQTEALKQDITELNRTIRDSSGPSYRKATAEGDRFVKRSSEGFDEVRESARSNAVEVAASFTGGFDQMAGGLQGFLAEFLAGFGPAGIVAGVGAAALLGTVTAAITSGEEAAEAQKEAVKSLAAEYIAAGGTGKRSFDDVKASISAMATSDGKDVVITLQRAFEAAKTAGADYQDVVTAIASSNPQQIAQARRAVEQLRQAHDDAATAATNDGSKNYSAAIRGAKAANDLEDALVQAEKQAREAAKAQQLAARAGLSDFQRKQDLLSQLAGKYDDAATGAEHFNKKTGEFEVAGFLADMRKVRKSLETYREDLAKADLSPEAEKFLESQGADSAAAMLRGYLKATPKQKAQLNEVWSTAGDQSASTYEDAIGKSLKGITVKAPKVSPPIVPAPDTSRLDAYLRQPVVKRVILEGVTRNGSRVF